MPLTSDHERFFHGFNGDSSDDRRAYTPNRDRGHRTNTPGRASGNTHPMNERTPGDEAHLNRYNMSTRGPRFQPRVIADRHHHDSSDQNCHPHSLVNGPSHLSAIALPPPCHLTETWAIAIEALVLTALPHGNLNTAGQAVPHHVVLWLPPRLLITPLMAVAVAVILLAMSVVDTVLPWHIQVAKVKVVELPTTLQVLT